MPTVTIELGQPTDRKPPFKFSAFERVGFSDTDAQGIVYYGRYLPYFDTRPRGVRAPPRAPGKEAVGKDFVMRATSIVYEAPARFDDLLEVFVRTKRIGVTSICFEHCVYRVDDDLLMCTAEQTMVLVAGPERRPTPISDDYRRAVADFEGTDVELAVPVE